MKTAKKFSISINQQCSLFEDTKLLAYLDATTTFLQGCIDSSSKCF